MALVQRVKNICLKPKQEWDVIAGETSFRARIFEELRAAARGDRRGRRVHRHELRRDVRRRSWAPTACRW